MARNYQDIIFKETGTLTGTYADGKKFILTFPEGDTEERRAFVMLLPGGGGLLGSMKWVADKLCPLGYVCAEFDPGTGDEFSQIAYAGCFDRFLHANHNDYGIVGKKGFGFGVSIGGATLWGLNICADVILTDPKFKSPANDFYPKAKMGLLGSASMPGGVDDIIYKYIDSGCVAHLDSHGDKDDILSIAKSQSAITQMNLMHPFFGAIGTSASRLDTYPGATHSLDGLHDIIISKTVAFFAQLMGLPIVPATTPT